MKIDISPDGDDLIVEAVNFKEARLLAILCERIQLLRSFAEDSLLVDTVRLQNRENTLAMVWTIPEQEGESNRET